MCIASFVGDNYLDRFGQPPVAPMYPGQPGGVWPLTPGYPQNPAPSPVPLSPDTLRRYKDWAKENGLPDDGKTVEVKYATVEQFEELKKEVLEMKELMKKAVKYDEEHDEPHCENEEKYEILRKIAKLVDVDLSEAIGGVNCPVSSQYK